MDIDRRTRSDLTEKHFNLLLGLKDTPLDISHFNALLKVKKNLMMIHLYLMNFIFSRFTLRITRRLMLMSFLACLMRKI